MSLIKTLETFAQAIEKHPNFELYAFQTFSGLAQAKITKLLHEFQEKILETDELQSIIEDRTVFSSTYRFMPYNKPEQTQKLKLPSKTLQLHQTLNDFYQQTNGLQFVWGYKKLADPIKKKAQYHISMYTKNAPAPWERWTAIDHHWSMGSIFIQPLQRMLHFEEEGNLYIFDKSADCYYPILPFDLYDNWSTAGIVINSDTLGQISMGEDTLASFSNSTITVDDFFKHHYFYAKGSILLREKSHIQMSSPDWALDELAAKIEEAQTKNNWTFI